MSSAASPVIATRHVLKRLPSRAGYLGKSLTMEPHPNEEPAPCLPGSWADLPGSRSGKVMSPEADERGPGDCLPSSGTPLARRGLIRSRNDVHAECHTHAAPREEADAWSRRGGFGDFPRSFSPVEASPREMPILRRGSPMHAIGLVLTVNGVLAVNGRDSSRRERKRPFHVGGVFPVFHQETSANLPVSCGDPVSFPNKAAGFRGEPLHGRLSRSRSPSQRAESGLCSKSEFAPHLPIWCSEGTKPNAEVLPRRCSLEHRRYLSWKSQST